MVPPPPQLGPSLYQRSEEESSGFDAFVLLSLMDSARGGFAATSCPLLDGEAHHHCSALTVAISAAVVAALLRMRQKIGVFDSETP